MRVDDDPGRTMDERRDDERTTREEGKEEQKLRLKEESEMK